MDSIINLPFSKVGSIQKVKYHLYDDQERHQGTFAKDKFIVLANTSKKPFENAQPHPYFDYEKKVFTKDGREEYIKEQKEIIKNIDKK